MLHHYFKIMFRNLAKSKLYSTINIAGLALGLTCCMLIVLYNKDEVSFDQFHVNKNQLHRLVATMSNEKETRKMGISNAPSGPAFKEGLAEVEAFVRVQSDYSNVKKGTEVIGQEVINADSNFFAVFTFFAQSVHFITRFPAIGSNYINIVLHRFAPITHQVLIHIILVY